jgi:hypothetical protein
MAGNKKPRKKHRPMPVTGNPLVYLQPLDRAEISRSVTAYHCALDQIKHGKHPGEKEWRDLADMVNMVEVMATGTHKYLPEKEVMPDVITATTAMAEAAKRWMQGKGLALSGPGLMAVGEVLSFYMQTLEFLTGADIERVKAELRLKYRKAIAGEYRNDERVVII